MEITTKSAKQTADFGLKLAKKAQGNQLFALIGDLGGGKTCFTQGFARGLGITKTIASPSFILMKLYKIKKGPAAYFCHVDAFRLKRPAEIIEIGLLEYLARQDTITVIEWADKIYRLILPYPKTIITFKFINSHTRLLHIKKSH